MKIYCLLIDSLPENSQLTNFLQQKGLKVIPQITNCYTTTSVISLLTGKLPSDLEQGGIGYETHYQNKKRGSVNYPWKHQMLTHKLHKKKWKIHLHNCEWFYETICNDKFLIKSTSCPVPISKAHDFRQTYEYKKLFLLDDIKNNPFYDNHKQHIRTIQSKKGNSFHLIKYNQYHDSIIFKTDKQQAIDRILNLLNCWDFDEPNSFFYVFSDHHDFTKIDKLCQCPSFLTWAGIKDNTTNPVRIDSNLWIGDFYTMIMSKFNNEIYCKVINPPVYFSEDARASVDLLNSTTAIACCFIDDKLIQTSYYKPENKYYGYLYDLKKKTIQAYPVTFKEILQGRFKWIP